MKSSLLLIIPLRASPLTAAGAQSGTASSPESGVGVLAQTASAEALTAFAARRGGEHEGRREGEGRRENVSRGRSRNVDANRNANRNLNRNVDANRNVNADRNVRVNPYAGRGVAAVGTVRPWVRRPYYGTVIAGVTLGTVVAATAVPVAPAPNLCWYWVNSAQTSGYWDFCP